MDWCSGWSALGFMLGYVLSKYQNTVRGRVAMRVRGGVKVRDTFSVHIGLGLGANTTATVGAAAS